MGRVDNKLDSIAGMVFRDVAERIERSIACSRKSSIGRGTMYGHAAAVTTICDRLWLSPGFVLEMKLQADPRPASLTFGHPPWTID